MNLLRFAFTDVPNTETGEPLNSDDDDFVDDFDTDGTLSVVFTC